MQFPERNDIGGNYGRVNEGVAQNPQMYRSQ